jgi:hypothetical protein
MRGWFHRGNDCGCNECDSCGGHHMTGGWGHHGGDCGCGDECGGHKWRDKMRGWFHRSDCCDTSCGCGGCGGDVHGIPAGTMAPPRAEPLPAPKEAPKKMPDAGMKSAQFLAPVPPVGSPARVIIEE